MSTDIITHERCVCAQTCCFRLFFFLSSLSGAVLGLSGELGCWLGWCLDCWSCGNSARAFPREKCTGEVARGTGRRKRMEQGFHVGGAGATGAVAVAAFLVVMVVLVASLQIYFLRLEPAGLGYRCTYVRIFDPDRYDHGGEGLDWLLLASTGSGASN